MFPISFLPRPSILTGAVVAMSVASGLAFGVLAGGALIVASAAARRA